MAEVKLAILKDLIQTESKPCVSIYMSTKAVHKGEFKKLMINFKNLIQTVRKKLKENWNLKSDLIDDLLTPALKLQENSGFWQQQQEGLAIFIAPDKFEYFKLAVDVQTENYVSHYFNIKQLISEYWDNRSYYLLALSPSYNQLFLADKNNLTEVKITELPANLRDFLNLDTEAEESYHSITSGGADAVFHSQAAEKDDQADLIHYLKEINSILKNKLESEPYLLLAADDNIFSLYQQLNSHANLLPENLSGNFQDLNKKELKEKSWNLIKPHLHDYLQKDKDRYLELKASSKTAADKAEIVAAAYYGKIDVLFLNKTVSWFGKFKAKTGQISESTAKDSYDLYNFAALQTILNGGKVYALNQSEIFEEADLLSIYRY
jgi:hypothetical protein